jgi:hypothetical protein
MKFDKLTMPGAIEKIKEELGTSWEGQKHKVESVFKPLVDEKASDFKSYSLSEYELYERNLASNDSAQAWLLKERGISYETAKRLHLGFRQTLSSPADDIQDILSKGWISIPSIIGDRVRLIKYRSVVRKAFARQPKMETVLFNTNTVDPSEDLYVVAGEFDAAVLEQAGFRTISLPADSTPITPDMKDKLMQGKRVILAGDSDQSGQKAMDKLDKLWYELQNPDLPAQIVFRLRWPAGVKDANQLWRQNEDIAHFRATIDGLTSEALSQPMAGVYSLAESMSQSSRTTLSDNPNRLRFPWPNVDKMAILLPGSVMSLMATNTKMGKTCFVMNFTIEAALKKEVVLNYQCELSIDEISNMVAAYLLQQNRNSLTTLDYKRAAAILRKEDVHYYVGRNPTLNTVGPVLDLIEAAIKRLGATIVVLDHIHFICRNESNQTEAEANAMQRIKRMAQQYQVKFIVVGQPRKAQQGNKGKIVHITDWKGSETGGSDADAVFALHRNAIVAKDPANPPMDDYEPQVQIHLLGARSKGDGPTFCLLLFKGEKATFCEESQESGPEELFGYKTA